MERMLRGLSAASDRNKKFIVKIKLNLIDLAEYNKAVFSKGRIVVSGGRNTLEPPTLIELKGNRFLPRKMIEVFYEDED